MPAYMRRELLTAAQRAELPALPTDRREIRERYSLMPADCDSLVSRRSPSRPKNHHRPRSSTDMRSSMSRVCKPVASCPYLSELAVGFQLFVFPWDARYLAQLPPEELEKYFRTAEFRRFTEKTICDPLALRKEVSNIFKQGYVKVDQKLELGAKCAHGFFERSDERLPSLGQTRCSSG